MTIPDYETLMRVSMRILAAETENPPTNDPTTRLAYRTVTVWQ